MIKDLVFTGTQLGMTDRQSVVVIELLGRLQPEKVHHGSCIGADEEFHFLVRQLYPEIKIHVHPAQTGDKRAKCLGDVHYPPEADPLKRNRLMVASHCDVLLATPKTAKMILRSGTWSTVRAAQLKERRVLIIEPMGVVRDEN